MIDLVSPATAAHVRAAVSVLRAEDADTMLRAGVDAAAGYEAMLVRSVESGAALLDGEPVAVWGATVESFLADDQAHVWLLIRGGVHRPAHLLAREACAFILRLQGKYARLVTTAAESHAQDQRWLRWLGFRRVPTEDVSAGGEWFLKFERVV